MIISRNADMNDRSQYRAPSSGGTSIVRRMIAKQLGCPSGLIGRYVLAALWNRRNAALNDSALVSLRLNTSDRVLDVGFGGGYLIDKMLNKVAEGHVSGIDASAIMVEQCRRKFADPSRRGVSISNGHRLIPFHIQMDIFIK